MAKIAFLQTRLSFPNPGCSINITSRYKAYSCELNTSYKVRGCFVNSVMRDFSAALKTEAGNLSETLVTTPNFPVFLSLKVPFYFITPIN